MRKVILYIATSLDGYIAGKGDELDWLFMDQDYGYESFIKGIEAIVMGWRSYEMVKSFSTGLVQLTYVRSDAV